MSATWGNSENIYSLGVLPCDPERPFGRPGEFFQGRTGFLDGLGYDRRRKLLEEFQRTANLVPMIRNLQPTAGTGTYLQPSLWKFQLTVSLRLTVPEDGVANGLFALQLPLPG